MPDELIKLLVSLSGWLIAALLGLNIFFVRDFMHRVQNSLDSLAKALQDHSQHIAAVDLSFTEKVARLDEQIAEMKRRR